MKKLIAVAIISTSLSGCALWDAYMMAGYDTTEYALVNRIKTQADFQGYYPEDSYGLDAA